MIRRAKESDLNKIAEINTNAWKINYKGIIDDSFLETRTADTFIKRRKESNWFENAEIFVYEEETNLKGFVSGEKKNKEYDCEIGALYVEPKYQKQGIGTKLLGYMKTYYKNIGHKKLIIWTIKGLQNNKFYEKHGGKIKEEKEYDYGDKKYPGIGYVFEL
jgi:N-acetylglutamate synthase-like GNAT family acetyltransferase